MASPKPSASTPRHEPGSGLAGSSDIVAAIVRGLVRFGSRHYYAINIGVSTNRSLALADAPLAAEGEPTERAPMGSRSHRRRKTRSPALMFTPIYN